jgi:hypothetical protein
MNLLTYLSQKGGRKGQPGCDATLHAAARHYLIFIMYINNMLFFLHVFYRSLLAWEPISDLIVATSSCQNP